MTTIVQVRRPFEALSMTNHSESRRKPKRNAASATYDEQDGDFLFTRGSKRLKTSKERTATTTTTVAKQPQELQEPAEAVAAGAISPERPLPVRRGRGRPSNTKKRAPSPLQLQRGNDDNNPPAASRRPQQRRKLDLTSSPGHDEAQVAPKRRTARETRSSVGAAADERHDRETTRPSAAARRTNGVKTTTDGGTKRTTAAKTSRKKQQKQQPGSDDNGGGEQGVQATPKNLDEALTKDPNATKIALPFSDTPINNRNKEFRKKGGAGGGGGRRSSMSMRGRRASSLIESGQSAIPHREVDPSEFFKHIEAEGLSEPRRMKQLLTWCGERALSEKPKHGSTGANAVLGARAIEDQLLKDFGAKSEFSDWFSRDDEPSDTAKAKRPIVIKPNPINVDHEQRITALEARIKQLKETRKSWRALQKPLPQASPLYPSDAGAKAAHIPESQFLDTNEVEMLESLIISADNNQNANAFSQLRSTTASRLRGVQNNMEFKVDSLADSIHKMDLRVLTASRQADRVLALAADRLREREEGERRMAGTKEMPVIEVLRSLGRILPENGG